MSEEMVNIKVDGKSLEVPKGTLAIRACEMAGVYVPRFCDHPLLKPVAACRACLIEVASPNRQGEVMKMPKPQPACSTTVSNQMEIYTQFSSEVAQKAQNGILEFLLVNHPLDCPICDKAGECPLQNQAFMEGNPCSRFTDEKRVQPKPVRLTPQILLDNERCVLCQRCVRFGKEIAGDAFIDLQGRGGGSSPRDDHFFMGERIGSFDTQVLGFYDPESNPDGATTTPSAAMTGPGGAPALVGTMNSGQPGVENQDLSGRRFASYFSGNITQICPVGALTSTSYRFRARPQDLISTPSVTDQDASGAEIRVDARRGVVTRQLAGDAPEINEEWISDKDRYAFAWQSSYDRLTRPMIRNEQGNLVETDWGTALTQAASFIQASARNSQVGFFPGGHLTLEDYYAWSKFARVVAGSNLIDARSRNYGDSEADFIRTRVAGKTVAVTYRDVEQATFVLLLDLEPEDECATLFLRLRKGVMNHGTQVAALAPYLSAGNAKLGAQLLMSAPGQQSQILRDITAGQGEFAWVREALSAPGALVLLGERAGLVSQELELGAALAEATGARWAWIPRRVGERAAIEAGAFPGLLSRGRLVTDPDSRANQQAIWGVTELPQGEALSAQSCFSSEFSQAQLAGMTLVMGGVDLRDLAQPEEARKALEQAGHVIQLEVRRSGVSEYADVVLPVAPPHEKTGTFINWEGRLQPFGQALASRALPDWKVMNLLGQAAGYELGLDSVAAILAEYTATADWDGPRQSEAPGQASPMPVPGSDQALLSTWKPLLDSGRCQDGAPDLANSARVPVVRMNAKTAADNAITTTAKISGSRGSVILPVVITQMPDQVVWMPECSPGSMVHETLGAAWGQLVTLKACEV